MGSQFVDRPHLERRRLLVPGVGEVFSAFLSWLHTLSLGVIPCPVKVKLEIPICPMGAHEGWIQEGRVE